MDPDAFLQALAAGDSIGVKRALDEDPTLAAVRAPGGASTLQWAVYHGRGELVDVLLGAGAEVDFPSACTIGRLKRIPPDVDVDALSPDGFTPLGLAVAFGHNKVARMLLEAGADPNRRSTALGGVAPIHAAVFGRNLEGLRIVADAGADVDAKQAGGFTALMGAAQNGDAAMVRYLVAEGADASARNEDGKSALDWATTDDVRAAFRPAE